MHSAVCGDRRDVAAQQGEQTGSDVEQIDRQDICPFIQGLIEKQCLKTVDYRHCSLFSVEWLKFQ